MQPVQDLTVEDRVSRTEFQYSLEDPDGKELDQWVRKMVAKFQSLPELRDVASDQQNEGLQVRLAIDRSTASRLGITPAMIDSALYDAFGQRQVSTMYTQLNQYHVVLEVNSKFQLRPEDLDYIFIRTAPGPTRAAPGEEMVKLSTFTHIVNEPAQLSVNHQGQFPAVTVSFNLAPNVSLGEAVKSTQCRQGRNSACPPASRPASWGTARRPSRPRSPTNEPLLILASCSW